MTKFAQFDKTSLKSLRDEMQSLLNKYGVDSNVSFEVGNMKFSSAEVEIKVSAKIVGAKTRTDTILERQISMLGLRMKNHNGDELVEYNTRAPKMPFVYLSARDGRRYKCTKEMAQLRFA
jgi:hypothetical protein